jgi:hypothetical protein
MARSLKAKFENWATDVDRENQKNNVENNEPEEYTPTIDITKNLKAKFEAIKLENNVKPVTNKPRLRVNRFVSQDKNGENENIFLVNQRNLHHQSSLH